MMRKVGSVFGIAAGLLLLASVLWAEGEDYHSNVMDGQTEAECDDAMAAEGSELHAQRMFAMGMLAGGAVHDIGNLITGLIARLEAARDGNASVLDESIELARQIARMARAITNLTRERTSVPVALRLEDRVREMVDVCAHFLRVHNVQEDWDGARLHEVVFEPILLNQVILNLLVNAEKAIDGHGTISIRARNETVTEPIPYDRGTVPPDEWVRLDIRDTGIGIPPENLTRIFDPLFTTSSGGTGHGLATVQRIMNAHGAHVLVESTVGIGTTFTLYLPARVRRLAAEPVPVPAPSNEVTVLLVDDDESVNEVNQLSLTMRRGPYRYRIVTARTPEEARAAFEEHAIDMVVVDYALEGIRGTDLAREFREKSPALLVLISSGIERETNGFPLFVKMSEETLPEAVDRVLRAADED